MVENLSERQNYFLDALYRKWIQEGQIWETLGLRKEERRMEDLDSGASAAQTPSPLEGTLSPPQGQNACMGPRDPLRIPSAGSVGCQGPGPYPRGRGRKSGTTPDP